MGSDNYAFRMVSTREGNYTPRADYGAKSMPRENEPQRQKIDFTKPVRAKGGCRVEIYNADKRHGCIYIDDNDFMVASWREDGTSKQHTIPDFDLVQETQKVVFYKNVYKGEYGYAIDNLSFDTRLSADRADESHKGERFACVRVEAEEGRFDE